ncbi:MAG: hypothetical protein EDM05_035820 [Leptolyngbya sp. IPPAS B-1204]
MARKRLSDLLREEDQKAAARESAPEPASNQPSVDKTDGNSDGKSGNQSGNQSSNQSGNQSDQTSAQTADSNLNPGPNPDTEAAAIPVTAEVIASQAEQVGDFVNELRNAAVEPVGAEVAKEKAAETDTVKSNVAPTVNPELVETLEATIAQLKQELTVAQERARAAEAKQAALQDQIINLETQVAAQSEALQSLQNEKQQLQQQSQQVEQLQNELADAKTMILQLSQTNTKPVAKPLPSTRAAEPELEPTNSQIVVPAAKPAPPDRPKLHQLELRRMLDHPTQPGSLPPMPSEPKPVEKDKVKDKDEVKLSEADVGWID